MCITAQIPLLKSEPLLLLHMPRTATFVPRTAHYVPEALSFSFHMFLPVLSESLCGRECVLFTWRKVTSARQVTWCCMTGNPTFEVAPGQQKAHVNIYSRQTVHRGKVDPGVNQLPRGNELSWDLVNRQ